MATICKRQLWRALDRRSLDCLQGFVGGGFFNKLEGKWQELADHGDHLNSHGPFLDSYRRMLSVWQELPTEEKYELSADNIRQIVAARPYPKG